VDGDTLLAVGVGTGSLLLLTQRRQPRARAIGADPGGRVLRLARSKVEYFGLAIELLHNAAGRPRVGAY
jgi:ubiquinone/menaquinone biosynthesis C-methylase UbiE